jgi:hypothetical protein
LLHGLATGEGNAFQRMFVACPKDLPNYIIHRDFRAMKRISLRVPTANTANSTALEENNGA